MRNSQPIELWELADSFNTYNFWLKMMRERGIREGKIEPINEEERAVVAEAKAVTS